MLSIVKVLKEKGRFYAGELPGTICFVPRKFWNGREFKKVSYAEVWGLRNDQAQETELQTGAPLMPNLLKPIDDYNVYGRVMRALFDNEARVKRNTV